RDARLYGLRQCRLDRLRQELSGPARLHHIKTLVKVHSRTEYHDRCTFDTRYFISSAPLNIERMAGPVRGHWVVESMHWLLDLSRRASIRPQAMSIGSPPTGAIRASPASPHQDPRQGSLPHRIPRPLHLRHPLLHFIRAPQHRTHGRRRPRTLGGREHALVARSIETRVYTASGNVDWIASDRSYPGQPGFTTSRPSSRFTPAPNTTTAAPSTPATSFHPRPSTSNAWPAPSADIGG